MTIRNIKESDKEGLVELLKEFGIGEDFLDSLWKSSSFVGELSFVIDSGDEIVGLMMLSKNKLNKIVGLTLAPLLIKENFQHKGLGKHLLKRGLNLAEQLGYDYVVALGNENFYEKYNFKPLSNFGVNGDENTTMLSLNNEEENLNCEIKYPRAFKYLKIKLKTN